MTGSSEHDRTTFSAHDGPPSLQRYLNAHHRRLDALRDYFVVENALSLDYGTRRSFHIQGRIRCVHGLFLDVDETLVLNDRSQVIAIGYGYHAGVEGVADRPIFRYDNAHPYAREGHPDDHHRHRYDPATWQEIEPPTWIGRDHRPLLSEAIEELREWWETTGRFLGLPEQP